MKKFKKKLINSIFALERYVESVNLKGYEPFDGLSSPLRSLTFGNLFCERLLQQLVRQSPINLRPLVGVKPLDSTKGRGYLSWGWINMYKIYNDEVYREKAIESLAWLDENKSPMYKHHSWGNHFEYSFRGGRIPKYEPTIVWTSLIGQVFLEAYELFKIPRHLEVIESIRNWIISLSRENTSSGDCISYVAFEQRSIHNSNMLGAAFLARAAKALKDDLYLDVAKSGMEYSCSRQLENGAWYYGHDQKYHWIDNFHTGYNLDSLKRYIDATGDKTFNKNLKTGYEFFKNSFFELSGRPKYYHNRALPIDIQCASQAIDTLTLFSEYDQESLEIACKVASWTIGNMQDKDGHFYYRKYPLGITAKAPMIHWAQATIFKAFTNLLLKYRNN